MANEAVIIELLGNAGTPIRYTVANATGIEKGTLMALTTDPKTITASAGILRPFAGIAVEEKVASDGQTSLACYTHGIFDLKLETNATCKAGDLLVLSGANLLANAAAVATRTDAYGNSVQGANAAMLSGMIVGKALEDGSSAEVIAVLVGGR